MTAILDTESHRAAQNQLLRQDVGTSTGACVTTQVSGIALHGLMPARPLRPAAPKGAVESTRDHPR